MENHHSSWHLGKKTSNSTLLLYLAFLAVSCFFALKVNNGIIIETNIMFHLDPLRALELFRTWVVTYNFGDFTWPNIYLVTVVPLFALLRSIGVSAYSLTSFWFGLTIFISLFFSFKLIKKVSPSANLIGAFAISMFYTFSPFFISFKDSAIIWFFLYALAPGFLLFAWRYLEEGSLIHLFGASALAFLAFSVNPVFNFIFCLLALYALMVAYPAKKSRICIFLVCLFLSTLVWNLGFIYTLFFHISDVQRTLLIEGPKMYNSDSSISESMLGFGFWGFYGSHQGIPYVNLANMYAPSALPHLSMILILAIALCLFLLDRKADRIALCAALFFVFSVFMVAGANAQTPTSGIYLFLYDTIPFFSIFRNGFKFVILIEIVYIILLSRIIKSKAASIVLLLLVGIFVFPLVSSSGLVLAGTAITSIPDYWYGMAGWINTNTSYSFILHSPAPYFQNYYWGGTAIDISGTLFNRPSIYSVGSSPYFTWVYSMLKTENWTRLAGFYNIGYVLQKNDIDYRVYEGTMDPSSAANLFGQSEGLTRCKTIGELDLYCIDPSRVRPHIYATVSCVNMTQSEYTEAVLRGGGFNRDIFSESSECRELKSKVPAILWVKKNQAEYDISSLQGADYYLVFSEKYDQGWVIFDMSSFPNIKTISSFRSNTYQNAFHVKGLSGNLKLFYLPYLLFLFSFAVSVSTLLSLLLIFLSGKLLSLLNQRKKIPCSS